MRRRPAGDRGATAVETALVLPLLLLLLGGILLLGLRLTYGALAGHAAEIALTKATLRTSAGYPTAAQVDASVRALDISDVLGDPAEPVGLTVTSTTWRKRQGDAVTVTVTYDVPALRAAAAFVPGMDGLAVISRTLHGRLE